MNEGQQGFGRPPSARSPARLAFAQAVQGPDAAIDPVRAALLLALEDDQDAALEPSLQQIEQLTAGIPAEAALGTPMRQLEALTGHLAVVHGFRGNEDSYYDPRNSLLTWVLASHAGIPITLALVYMAVGRRRGIPLLPIGLPGHMVLRHAEEPDAYIDPFTGVASSEHHCLERVLGREGLLGVPDESLEPMEGRPLLLRLLNNLKGAYLRGTPPSLEGALGASERILLLYPDTPDELRDRGLLNLKVGRPVAALRDLERYIELVPGNSEAMRMRAQVDRLHRQVSRLN